MNVLDEILAAFHDQREVLELDGQRLTELPPQIGLLTNLQVLSLSCNQLTRLPPEIGNLSKLVELAVNENCLTELPAQIGRLTSLEILLLSHNQLRKLPPEIGKLTRLRRLDIQDNHLSELPEEFARIESLQDLNWTRKGIPPRDVRRFIAHGNPWIYPPAEIMKKPVDAIRDYLKGEGLDNPLLNGNGMNWDRWASPPAPDSQPEGIRSWNPPACPVPPPLPCILSTQMTQAAPHGFAFQTSIALPARTLPHLETRLQKEFPEIKWQGIDGGRNAPPGHIPMGHVNVWISGKQSPGPFHLTVTTAALDQSEAEKVHHETIRRLIWALIGWWPFPSPHFKPRPAVAVDTEEIINLPALIEGPRITISDFNSDILVSRTLVEALSLYREVLKGWADAQNRDILLRGSAAFCMLAQSRSETMTQDLEGLLGLVRPAHGLLAELIELGLAQVVFYGPAGRAPGGRSISLPRVKVRYFGGLIAYSAPDGEAASLGEFLRLNPT